MHQAQTKPTVRFTILKGAISTSQGTDIDVRTPLAKIVYMKKVEEHIQVHLCDGSRLTKKWTNLKPFLADLNHPDILQIHESTAINTNYLYGFNPENGSCYLSATGRNEQLVRLPISDGRLAEFKARFASGE